MKFNLKTILVSLFVLIAIPFFIALFVPNDYNVESSIDINQSKPVVFDYIKSLNNQNKYSKWSKIDPKMKSTYRGTDKTVGYVSAWERNHPDVGIGEQEIIKISEGNRIDFELRFYKPFEAVSNAYMITETITEYKTKVRWGFDGHMDYPFNLMLISSSFKQTLKNDFDIGLKNLKKILETESNKSDY